MKKRWLSLAVAFLMVFALISQGVTPVLAEKGIEIGQAEEQLNIEADEASNIEEELLIGGNEEGPVSGNELSVDQTGDGLTVGLEDLGLDLDANGIVRDELTV